MELNQLILDNINSDLPINSWRFASNILIGKGFRSIINEPSFELKTNIVDGYNVVGKLILNKRHIYTVTNGVKSKILNYDIGSNTVTTIISDQRFNFQLDKEVTFAYTYNANGELIIAFTDDYNTPKVLNVDNLPFTIDGTTKEPTTYEDYYLVELFPDVSIPTITSMNVIDGGSLMSGVYYIPVKYGFDDESSTPYLTMSNPITITDKAKGIGFDKFNGCDGNVRTGKSINITFDNIDERYNYLYIGVIHKANGQYTAYESRKYSINGNSITIGISSLSSFFSTGLTEIITEYVAYTKIKSITSSSFDNKLYAANLETLPVIDYQSYANDIVIEWVREDVVALQQIDGSYKDPNTIFFKRHFRHEEVKAFYIKLKLKKGGTYCVCHIPGRIAETGDKDVLAGATYAQDVTLDSTVYKFQTRDTVPETSMTRGHMSYWENRNEVYSDDFPDFAGQNVRHHKFPSLKYFKDQGDIYYTDEAMTTAGNNYVGIMGIIVSNVVIPDELMPYIDSWEILYAEPTIDNSLSFGQSFVYPLDIFLGNIVAPGEEVRVHPFDLMSSLNNVPVSYLRCIFKYRASEYNNYFFNGTGSGGSTGATFNETDMTLAANMSNISATNEIITVYDNRFIPANNSVVTPDNEGCEQYYHLIVNKTINSNLDTSPSDYEIYDRYFVTLCSYKTNVYFNYKTQSLVSTGIVIKVDNSANLQDEQLIYGGDGFWSLYYNIAYSHLEADLTVYSSNKTAYYLKKGLFAKQIVESIHNINLRNIGLEEWQNYYKNETDSYFIEEVIFSLISDDTEKKYTRWFKFMEQGNYFGYNTDYNSLNNLIPYSIYDETINVNTSLPFRIASSLNQKDTTNILSWRSFKASDYYDMPKKRDEIWSIVAEGRAIYISQIDALSIAAVKQYLRTDSATAYLAAGELFSNSPEEVISSEEGTIGNNCQFATILTLYGLVVIDRKAGKIFLVKYNEQGIQQTEISDNNSKEYFKNYFDFIGGTYINGVFTPTSNSYWEDNPLSGNGCHVVYDDIYKRLIFITKKKDIYQGTNLPDEYDEETNVKFILGINDEASVGTAFSCYLLNASSGTTGTLVTFSVTTSTPSITKFRSNSDLNIFASNIAVCIQSWLEYYHSDTRYSIIVKDNIVIVENIDGTLDNTSTSTIYQSCFKWIKSEPKKRILYYSNILSYDVANNKWVSFHDYGKIPSLSGYNKLGMYFITNGELSDNTSLFQAYVNQFEYGKYLTNDYKSSIIDFVYTLKSQLPAILDTVSWSSDVYVNKIRTWDKTFDYIMCYTENQCTAVIPLVRKEHGFEIGNVAYIGNSWHFNDIVDYLLSPTYRFLDDDFNLMTNDILADTEVSNTNMVVGFKYKIGNISTITDYITYNGKNYINNNEIFECVTGHLTYTTHGNAKVYNYKEWYDKSLLKGNYFAIRLILTNDGAKRLVLNDFKINLK